MALLQGFDLDDLDPFGADFVHTVVECAKLAFADREAWYGDPDFVDVPMRTLLGAAYNDHIDMAGVAGDEAVLGDGRLAGAADRRLADPGPGRSHLQPADQHARDAPVGAARTQIHRGVLGDQPASRIDRWGNMVSATPSGGWLQSSPVIPELGCCLGTRMQMLWLEEGLPASLAPGRRPRSTLSPSMAFKDGNPYLAFGTPGGDQQDQWSLLMFLHHVRSPPAGSCRDGVP